MVTPVIVEPLLKYDPSFVWSLTRSARTLLGHHKDFHLCMSVFFSFALFSHFCYNLSVENNNIFYLEFFNI